jgi:hypothetical protein
MPGVTQVWEHGPVTRTVNSAITGGHLVQARTDSKVETATAGSVKVLGVAMNDAAPDASGEGTTTYGAPVTDISLPQPYVSIGRGYFKVTYGGAVAFGERLKAGASGKVVKWVSGTDAADLIVGRCEEEAGVSGDNIKGIALIY